MPKNFFLVLLVSFVLTLPFFVISADFHVSTAGNDTQGDGTSGNPWRTPEFGAKQLNAGDTLLIHEGTYLLSKDNLPTADANLMDRVRALVSPAANVTGTSTNPITIKSAGDGTVFLDAGQNPEWAAVGTVWGSDFVIIDGLSIRGAAILWGTKNSLVQNCNIFGGLDTPRSNGGDDFGNVLRVEYCTDCTVKNNILHDNGLFGETRENSPLIMQYQSTNLLIENNDLFNSVGHGIYMKDTPVNLVFRNNFVYNNYLSGMQGGGQGNGADVKIHNNVFLANNTSNDNEQGGIRLVVWLDGWEIYNNTFVNNGYASLRNVNVVTDINAWNNIYSTSSNYFYHVGWGGSGATFSNQWTYSDYNQFYGSANWRESTEWSTLAAYVSATGFDPNSTQQDPGFSNANGTNAADFKRAQYTTDGRGGSYSNVKGAYINGSEQIGSFGVKLTPKKPDNTLVE